MKTFENIKKYREQQGLSQAELAELVGYTDRSSIAKIEKGAVDISESKIAAFAKALNVTPDVLMGISDEDLEINMDLIKFPVIGKIAAGFDSTAVSEETGEFAYFKAAELSFHSKDYFVLKVKGNSMYPKLLDGDIVLVHKQTSVDSGDIAVILYDGEDATLKKVSYEKGKDYVDLIPFNPEYETKRIEKHELEECRVLGKVVKLQRNL